MSHLHAVSLLIAAVLLGAVVPRASAAHNRAVYLGGFPLLKQQHSLTCEAAATSMATRAVLSEGQIMAAIPRNPNPNLGFRGNPDGEQGTVLRDYGVYAGPVQRALAHYGYTSQLLSYASVTDIRTALDQGWPVVAWITYKMEQAVPRLAWARGGQFFLVPHEHAVLVVGYRPGLLYVQDPWDGTRAAYDLKDFTRAWGYFGDMGLAVQPCQVPPAVSHLRLTDLSSASATWTWTPVAGAHYQVRVIRNRPHRRVTNHTLSGPSFTLRHPLPGETYQLIVTAVAVCGAPSPSVRLWTQLPLVLPSPTPEATVTVATPVTVPRPTGTPVSTSTPGTPAPPPAPSVTPTP